MTVDKKLLSQGKSDNGKILQVNSSQIIPVCVHLYGRALGT
jgi:hypothetical protein